MLFTQVLRLDAYITLANKEEHGRIKMKCLLGFHTWVQDCERCSRCDFQRLGKHKWSGCRCSVCGKTRNEGHQWKGCKCDVCGTTRDESHD